LLPTVLAVDHVDIGSCSYTGKAIAQDLAPLFAMPHDFAATWPSMRTLNQAPSFYRLDTTLVWLGNNKEMAEPTLQPKIESSRLFEFAISNVDAGRGVLRVLQL
jgi:hypothetical protein